jgi:hypothetical protein
MEIIHNHKGGIKIPKNVGCSFYVSDSNSWALLENVQI